MATSTEKLKLFKYNVTSDAAEAFNIEQALNANWDIIDREFGVIKDLLTSLSSNVSRSAIETDASRNATETGVAANIYIETFESLSDTTITSGKWNEKDEKIEVE